MASIILSKVGPEKVKVIKIVREVTDLGLKEAKDAVDSVESGVPFEMTVIDGNENDILNELSAIGAIVAVSHETNTIKQDNTIYIEEACENSTYSKNVNKQKSDDISNNDGEFILFGQVFTIPASYIHNYKLDEACLKAAKNAKNEFDYWYKNRSGIEDVLKNYTDFALEMVVKYAFTPLFGSLGSFNIYDISDDKYINRCVDGSTIDKAFDDILYELEKIVDDQNEMKQYRANRKAYRSRMVGGGFGLSGAVKGAVQAGAINATTGMAHSAVNAIGNMGSAIAASGKKSSLYNNKQTKDVLAKGMCLSIINTYENHKCLINEHFSYYYEVGFDKDKSKALFENAMRYPDKCERLLVESVVNYPDEKTLSYIFKHYEGERKNVYAIGKVFGLDFGKHVEETFAALYTAEAKLSAQNVERIKHDILATMEEFGISTSDTLNQINYDELVRIASKYLSAIENDNIQQSLAEFNKYDAPLSQKKHVVQEKGIWQLASKYEVVFTVEEIERILKRYYTEDAQVREEEAQNAKKRIVEIMNVLGVQTSATFDRLEKDCIARICEKLEESDEETCNLMRDKIVQYDALEKNKKEYLDMIQKQIEAIWTKEDGEIFDNVYLNTDIYNQSEINSSIEFIRQKGRTSNAERYIAALQACNEKNIKDARTFQEKRTKTSNTVGIVLLLAGILCLFIATPLVVIAIPGLALMLRYNKLKKNWNILTLDGTQIHGAIKSDNREGTPNEEKRQALLNDKGEIDTTSTENNHDKMVCSSCGKEINSSASFCKYCGKKIEKQ